MRAALAHAWVRLIIAGALEVVWASLFKVAFRANHPVTAVPVAAMVASFWFLSMAMRSIPVGTAYAVWTGIGAAGAAIVGVLLYREPATAVRILSIVAIVGGVVGLRLSSGAGH